ncbi:MAG TPA: HEAT repeat domain-containing protein, partial [Polyangiaceae bacterium]
MKNLKLGLIASGIVLGALVTQGASAQGKGKGPAAPAAPAATLSPTAAQDLRSGDEAKVRAALDDVRMAGKSKAGSAIAPVVAEVLTKGLSLALTEAALDTLGDLEVEGTSAVIASYLQHRNVKIRQAAVKALLHTKGAVAVRGLRRALGDQDAMVRGVAATGLGSMKAKDAVPDLFLALEHRVNEAAGAIGMLCAAAECDQLSGKLGRLPFDVMSGGIEQILFRPTAEVNDDTKIKMIGKLRELGTPETNKFLRDVAKRFPKDA